MAEGSLRLLNEPIRTTGLAKVSLPGFGLSSRFSNRRHHLLCGLRLLLIEESQTRKSGCMTVAPVVRQPVGLTEVVNEHPRAMRGQDSYDRGSNAERVVSAGDQRHLVLQAGIYHLAASSARRLLLHPMLPSGFHRDLRPAQLHPDAIPCLSDRHGNTQSCIRSLLLRFGAVDEQAWVYLNGSHVGEHTVESEGIGVGELWNRPFTIEVEPDAIRFGEDNYLVVRMHASSGMSGIWGDVRVYLAPEE